MKILKPEDYPVKLTMDEYQAHASCTMNSIENPTDRRFNALLGLLGEIGELTENAFAHSAFCSEYQGALDDFVQHVIDFGSRAEHTKHEIFHKHPKGSKIATSATSRFSARQSVDFDLR